MLFSRIVFDAGFFWRCLFAMGAPTACETCSPRSYYHQDAVFLYNEENESEVHVFTLSDAGGGHENDQSRGYRRTVDDDPG
jgi:hypothetical protein